LKPEQGKRGREERVDEENKRENILEEDRMEVPKKCPFVLLVDVSFREGKALGSEVKFVRSREKS
jgi:hypothetical protein